MFQRLVGCADTEGLFACRPHSLGNACMAGHPGPVAYATASASWLASPPLPAPKSTPKGTGLQVVTFGAEQVETRLSQSPFALPGQRGKRSEICPDCVANWVT